VSWWLTPVILAIQEAEIRRITVQNQPRPYLEKKKNHKKGLVEWLEVTGNSSCSTDLKL
jgi:hypothetical protein